MEDGLNVVAGVGREAARRAGRILLEGYGREIKVGYKGIADLVTEIDWASEKEIIRVIQESFPEDDFLGEEGGAVIRSGVRRWVIDPLDGTMNFTHHFPFFAVSIGYEEQGEVRYGIVYDPLRNQIFEAFRGGGAFRDGKPIGVSATERLSKSLLATGFAPTQPDDPTKGNLALFNRFSRQVQGLRRTGSAALDLCYVASGALDGFWELGLAPWDTAAGSLMVLEAGGMVTDRDGGRHELTGPVIVASNGRIHREMISVLNASTP